jgi:3-hydroxybutyryl-CoA dehydrogenase
LSSRINILVLGDERDRGECMAKFGPRHEYTLAGSQREAKFYSTYDLAFDFILDEDPGEANLLFDKPNLTVFVNTAKISLDAISSIYDHKIQCKVFGFAGLPTFLNRPLMEVSLLRESDRPHLDNLCKALNTEYEVVGDRVGMVTPRIICAIVNEAYYTAQEGTASREDIDTAMKLGTNYPYGPFEWTARIGLKHVYETLDALWEDTRDERFRICPLLKREYFMLEE